MILSPIDIDLTLFIAQLDTSRDEMICISFFSKLNLLLRDVV